MRKVEAHFPKKIWDGTSPTRQSEGASALLTYRAPDATDWTQITEEMIQVQKLLQTPRPIVFQECSQEQILGRPVGDSHYDDLLEAKIALKSTANLVAHFSLLATPMEPAALQKLQLQFSLDGKIFSPDEIVYHSLGNSPERQIFRAVMYAFDRVPAGQHVVRARLSNAGSGQLWSVSQQKLLVTL